MLALVKNNKIRIISFDKKIKSYHQIINQIDKYK